ncbi:hypothetical protein V6N13_054815 [Hibiscus sabdariffa]|uniref:Agglutinin domain-containing protein n=1 Tax=Hibiscus sabdariffa TaxID=183260 RepID=A0ABR2DXU4_9ROSI
MASGSASTLAMAMASNLTLPRFIALGFNPNSYYVEFMFPTTNYLSFVRDGGNMDGCIKFFDTKVENPYTKFEVEAASANGLFHIRSCQNNRYWERNKHPDKYWITATAKDKDEDQSKESCTLFKFVYVDPGKKLFRIVHVQSGYYLSLSGVKDPATDFFVHAKSNEADDQYLLDVFELTDWDSLLILPRYVAFRGDLGKYLCVRYHDSDRPYLQFATSDIGDSTVPCEIFALENGDVRIKSISEGKFWRRSPNWIWADSGDTSSNNRDTLFRPVKVDSKTIGLINLGNNSFCKRLNADGKENCLNAAVPSVTKEARLIVEEPVLTREIYGVKYNLDYSRVYGQSILAVARNSATNDTEETSTLDVKLSYTDTKESTWKDFFTLRLGMKASMDFSIPLIFEGNIEISGEVESGVEWGETRTSTTVLEVVHSVTVPPMTKVTVNMVATKGYCDVPFTYQQRDTLYDGTTLTSEIEGGIYTGSNYYNIDFVTEEEKL